MEVKEELSHLHKEGVQSFLGKVQFPKYYRQNAYFTDTKTPTTFITTVGMYNGCERGDGRLCWAGLVSSRG